MLFIQNAQGYCVLNMSTKVTDFTRGNPAKHIMRFFWPLLLTSTLQQVYSFVDMMIVGSGLGDQAFTAVGNMGSIFFLIVGFSFGLANGFGVMIAHSFGSKNEDELRHRLAGTIQLTVIIAVTMTIASLLLLPLFLKLLNTDQVLMKDCLTYGYIIFGGLTASICYNVSSAVLRALGDSKTPLTAIITSSVVNLALDSLFIFVLHTGVGGAAAATVISQVVSTLVCVIRLKSIDMLHLSREDFRNERKVYIDLIRNGIPMALMNSITAIGCMTVQHFINSYGVAYTTAYSACSKYLNLFMNPAATAGNAMSAYTSQNFGARRFDRIKQGLRVCLTISFITYVCLGSMMVLFPEPLVRILIKGDEAVSLACGYFPICGIAIIAVDCLFVVRSGVQGMGDPVLPMWSGVLEMVLRISAISLLIGTIGFKAAAIAEVCAWTGALALNVVGFLRIMLPNLNARHVSVKYALPQRLKVK